MLVRDSVRYAAGIALHLQLRVTLSPASELCRCSLYLTGSLCVTACMLYTGKLFRTILTMLL
jgi:hypothetical protein